MRRPDWLMCFACLLVFGSVGAEEPLTVLSWGGAYETSQRRAYFEPFTARTGIPIAVEQYNGGIEDLRRQVEAGSVRWDLVDLIMADNLRACEEGLLLPFDADTLPPAPDGTPAAADFIAGTLSRCGVPQIVSATVLAYDPAAFPGAKPTSIRALFDPERFPGKRALQRQPMANLEWALLSYGVPRQDIYPLLSTERGLRLAFERLERIREHIVWWEAGSEPPRLLAEGEVVMASGYNGRFFNATIEGVPLVVIWDGQLLDYSTWGIPRGTGRVETAQHFVRFATATEQLAEQARYIAYGPARHSSGRRIGLHADSGVDIRPHLPTWPANLERAIRKDHRWYARTQRRLNQRFQSWLDGN